VSRRRSAGVLLVLWCSIVWPEDRDKHITFYGIGGARVGMTPAEAGTALGDQLVAERGRLASDPCVLMHPSKTPTLVFLVENGTVARVETADARWRVESGIRAGSGEADVRRAYGDRLEVTPHQYDPKGHYMTIRSADRLYAIVFETDGKTVDLVRAGRVPAAEYVEHCL
jgi:hypothetical protein